MHHICDAEYGSACATGRQSVRLRTWKVTQMHPLLEVLTARRHGMQQGKLTLYSSISCRPLFALCLSSLCTAFCLSSFFVSCASAAMPISE
eukprot:6198967-Pleurochrysis_carterae.AAC.1